MSVWQIEKNHNLGIFEAGISLVGEMEKIASVINCSIGIFTNIGDAHDEGFASKKEKIQEKIKLFEHAKTIIYCRDNDLVDEAFTKFPTSKLFSWSHYKKADLQILAVDKKEKSTKITAIFKEKTFAFIIPFIDAAAIENAIHCAATMLLLDIPFKVIQKRMLLLEPVSMRLELKEGINNCTIINDSYSADLTSLELALNFATKRTDNKPLILFLSDILQLSLIHI